MRGDPSDLTRGRLAPLGCGRLATKTSQQTPSPWAKLACAASGGPANGGAAAMQLDEASWLRLSRGGLRDLTRGRLVPLVVALGDIKKFVAKWADDPKHHETSPTGLAHSPCEHTGRAI